MDNSFMLLGLVTVFTAVAAFLLMTTYYFLPNMIKKEIQSNAWVQLCLFAFFIGVWIFAIGYLIL